MSLYRSFHFTPLLLTLAMLTGGYCHADHHLHHEPTAEEAEDGWVSLFNGKDLEGWEVAENPETFSVQDGKIVIVGDRAHAFYKGDVADANFKNFEWKCEIMTKPNANAGMYFHTKFQESGWPSVGYEAQINCTHVDPIKTGSLYGVENVDKANHEDGQWFTQHLTVKGKRIIIKVNDEVQVDYTEPENAERKEGFEGRLLSSGTFALQGHDPGSEVHIRKVLVKVLED